MNRMPLAAAALMTALEAVPTHRLAFWDAMLWASAQRAGVRRLLTEDFQDGFALQDVKRSSRDRNSSTVPARLEALFLKSHAPSFGVTQRSEIRLRLLFHFAR